MPIMPASEHFSVDDRGYLVVHRTTRRGVSYEHRCSREVFEEVAHTLAELGGATFVLLEIWHAKRKLIPVTQIAVAIAFLKERGIVVASSPRRNVASSDDVWLDAMVEYSALREERPEVDALEAGLRALAGVA